MQDNQLQNMQSVTFRCEKEVVDKINELKKGTERNTSAQIRLMLKKFIEITESTGYNAIRT
jgi:predicted transcriptional regulator